MAAATQTTTRRTSQQSLHHLETPGLPRTYAQVLLQVAAQGPVPIPHQAVPVRFQRQQWAERL
jgi:hypothetical protein